MLAVVFAFSPWPVSNYGLASDQTVTRNVGKYTVEYVLGESDKLLRLDMRFIGSAFTVVLYAAERALGLTDVLRARLPMFRVRLAHTGQYIRDRGELWRVAVPLSDAGA